MNYFWLWNLILATSLVHACKSVQNTQPSATLSIAPNENYIVCLKSTNGVCDTSQWMPVPPHGPQNELSGLLLSEWSSRFEIPKQPRNYYYNQKQKHPEPRLSPGRGVPYLVNGVAKAVLLFQYNGDLVYWNTQTWSAKVILKSDRNGARIHQNKIQSTYVKLQNDGNLVLQNDRLSTPVIDSTNSFPRADQSIHGATVAPSAVHLEFISPDVIALCGGVIVPGSELKNTSDTWYWRRIWRSDQGPIWGDGQGYMDNTREKCNGG